MKKVFFPMKVHAVKLEYRRLILEKSVRGYFKVKNGRQYVYITRDPTVPSCDVNHPRKLLVTSKRGKMYSDLINESLSIKAEYDSLLQSWNSIYNFAPPRIKFPIKQFADPHEMNNDYFLRQRDCLGKYTPDKPTVSDNGKLKSKNEQIAADLLNHMGIPFKYETALYLPSIEEMLNPDFLINFYEIDKCVYVEILGMSEKIDYTIRTAKKLKGFSYDYYRPGREVIYIFLYDKQNFDEDYFVSQVLSAFNDMIPDSAIIWNTNSEDRPKAV